MATIVDCPSCSRKLRVPDELLGKKVKCPTCSGTFDAQASSAPGDSTGATERMASSPRGADATPLARTEATPHSGGGSIADQETQPLYPLEPAAERDLEPCPYCGEKIAREATRCRYCGEELGEDDRRPGRPWDQEYRPYRDVRRDSEPHRGSLILTLGIVSIVTAMFLGPVGLIVGMIAWIMGQRDLKKMRANVMDPQGLGSTQAGWICGIIGTAFGGLYALLCVGYMVFVAVMVSSAARMTPTPAPPPPPVMRPVNPGRAAPGGRKAGPGRAPVQPKAPEEINPPE
jgi:predicted Zn finger-like uncharacterized protein